MTIPGSTKDCGSRICKPNSPGHVAATQVIESEKRQSVKNVKIASVGRFYVTPASQSAGVFYNLRRQTGMRTQNVGSLQVVDPPTTVTWVKRTRIPQIPRNKSFVPQLAQHPAHPRRMHPRLQGDPTARHSPEHLLHGLRSRAHLLFQQHFARFIQHAIPTGPIAQIQTDGQFPVRKILRLACRCSANLFYCRSPLSLALRARR
jgi:hypothetical protein